MTIGGQRYVCPLPSNSFLNHIFQPLWYKGKYNSQQSSFVPPPLLILKDENIFVSP